MKTKNHERVILNGYAATPLGNRAIVLNFGMRGVIVNVITHVKFFVNWFSGLGVLTPEISLSLGLAGRSYHSISCAVLHCDLLDIICFVSQYANTTSVGDLLWAACYFHGLSSCEFFVRACSDCCMLSTLMAADLNSQTYSITGMWRVVASEAWGQPTATSDRLLFLYETECLTLAAMWPLSWTRLSCWRVQERLAAIAVWNHGTACC